MRKLKNQTKFRFSSLLPRPVQFRPVVIDERDELMRAIAYDADNRGNNWTLDERPDSDELQAYLQQALED